MSDPYEVYRSLAFSVLNRAAHDIARNADRPGALQFLTTPSADLAFWCNVAGINPRAVIQRSRMRWSKHYEAMVSPRPMQVA